jgi:hypothetical protein
MRTGFTEYQIRRQLGNVSASRRGPRSGNGASEGGAVLSSTSVAYQRQSDATVLGTLELELFSGAGL